MCFVGNLQVAVNDKHAPEWRKEQQGVDKWSNHLIMLHARERTRKKMEKEKRRKEQGETEEEKKKEKEESEEEAGSSEWQSSDEEDDADKKVRRLGYQQQLYNDFLDSEKQKCVLPVSFIRSFFFFLSK
jgi:hypothetical protein